jgi:hypothetical protein
MVYTYGQAYEAEKQEVIRFLDMQMDTKKRDFFIGFVSYAFNDAFIGAIGTDGSYELEQYLIGVMRSEQEKIYGECENEDHDDLEMNGELVNCSRDCKMAETIFYDYGDIDNDALADHLLSNDGQTIIINDDFETEFFEFLSHYKDDQYGRD